ncbi:hypothetical protein GCM10007860_29170 [Chitiniphilus shinanonensis]|uniref:Uncharacterized protein n=1 Tax=Chitiniphilus shinanonensis TaxID=553088 RepID=A0ABQ6BUT8_9NEIS|nr:hypothetical protein GCM10007860_29170 [Chitiniphilus shinanonensis]
MLCVRSENPTANNEKQRAPLSCFTVFPPAHAFPTDMQSRGLLRAEIRRKENLRLSACVPVAAWSRPPVLTPSGNGLKQRQGRGTEDAFQAATRMVVDPSAWPRERAKTRCDDMAFQVGKRRILLKLTIGA